MSENLHISPTYLNSNWGTTSVSGITYGGTGITIVGGTLGGQRSSENQKRIGPSLYFKYVKSKLNKLEQKNLKTRLSKLQSLLRSSKENDQQGLYETLAEKIVNLIREQEAASAGFDKWIDYETVQKFMRQVKDSDGNGYVSFCKLEEFPRLIPKDVTAKLKVLKKKNIFNELWILHLTYNEDKLKTNKEKIKEKDPIVFGRLTNDQNSSSENPSKLFYITDWVDEYCDLTLEKFTKVVKAKDLGDINTIEEFDEKFIKNLKEEVDTRKKRLSSARPNNFRDLMTEEDKEKELNKLPKWKRIVKKLFKL